MTEVDPEIENVMVNIVNASVDRLARQLAEQDIAVPDLAQSLIDSQEDRPLEEKLMLMATVYAIALKMLVAHRGSQSDPHPTEGGEK